MKLQHAEDQKTQRGASGSFSGTAWQQTLAVGEGPNPLHVATWMQPVSDQDCARAPGVPA